MNSHDRGMNEHTQEFSASIFGKFGKFGCSRLYVICLFLGSSVKWDKFVKGQKESWRFKIYL